MKKKNYLSPEMELVEFNPRNVITTSVTGDIDPDLPDDPKTAPRRSNGIWD